MEKVDGGYEFGNGTKVKILAYADDICVIGQNKEEIERILKELHDYTQWAGLRFNPAKCGWSLHDQSHQQEVCRKIPANSPLL